jgi:hypothetical protein
MNSKLARCLIVVLGVLALQPAAYATYHLMQIEQVIVSVDGDPTAQAIQLRMRSTTEDQNFVSNARLVVLDAAGQNPIIVLDIPTDVANGSAGSHVLLASANFLSHTIPATVPDFTIANPIPASYFAAGSLLFQSDAGILYWRLSWGGAAYTGPNTGAKSNDADGNFGPPFASALPSSGVSALQFQGSATAKSTTNAADYLLTTSTLVFVNNSGASFTLTGATLPTVTVTAPDPSASEVPSTDTGKYRIARTGSTTNALTVFYAITGTATNGTDYQRLLGRANIAAGRPNVMITLRPIDDTIVEPDETAILTLSANANYTVGSPNSATVTIHSNE